MTSRSKSAWFRHTRAELNELENSDNPEVIRLVEICKKSLTAQKNLEYVMRFLKKSLQETSDDPYWDKGIRGIFFDLLDSGEIPWDKDGSLFFEED